MTATQLITGQGGWPNSVFLTPDARAVLRRHLLPAATTRTGARASRASCRRSREAWRAARRGGRSRPRPWPQAMRQHLARGVGPARAAARPPSVDDGASERASPRASTRRGAASAGRPSSRSPSNLCFLLRARRRATREAREMLVDDPRPDGPRRHLRPARRRLPPLRHRREWLVPHFEKMLYDNALLAGLYAEAARTRRRARASRAVARATLDFVLREMTAPEGGFSTAIDAETGRARGGLLRLDARGARGALLGAERPPLPRRSSASTGPPFFEHDRYVLHLPRRSTSRRAAAALSRGRAAAPRSSRPRGPSSRRAPGGARPADRRQGPRRLERPHDRALAAPARRLAEPRYLEPARRAAGFVLLPPRETPGDTLLHAWRDGQCPRARLPRRLRLPRARASWLCTRRRVSSAGSTRRSGSGRAGAAPR